MLKIRRAIVEDAAARTPIAFYQKMGMEITGHQKVTSGPCLGMTVVILEKSLY